jgi:shikimate kinase
MGSGKSFWAKKMSEHTSIPSIDLDEYIEKKESSTIKSIFEEKGEAYFRQKENDYLKEIVESNPNCIIACGGGTPCFFEAIDYMNEHGKTIFLHTDIDILVSRLTPQLLLRPLLNDNSLKDINHKVSTLLRNRMPIYEKCQVILEMNQVNEYTFANIISTHE